MPNPTEQQESPDDDRVVSVRLQKFLARAGVASRRGSEDLMTAGRVAVNGIVVTELGYKVDPVADTVTVDGRVVEPSETPTYLVLNKPAGYITTMSDPRGRRTVAELVPVAEHPGLFPVGRLDRDTTGLLLFTTDGELGFALLHPRFHVSKTYEVEAEGVLDAASIDELRTGLLLDDGMTAPAEVRVVRSGGANVADTSEVEVTIREGRKRQVRRMFSAVGHPVVTLHRVRFGPIELGDLALGTTRELREEEVDALRSAGGAA